MEVSRSELMPAAKPRTDSFLPRRLDEKQGVLELCRQALEEPDDTGTSRHKGEVASAEVVAEVVWRSGIRTIEKALNGIQAAGRRAIGTHAGNGQSVLLDDGVKGAISDVCQGPKYALQSVGERRSAAASCITKSRKSM